MEEKVIIKSQQSAGVKIIRGIFFLLGALVLVKWFSDYRYSLFRVIEPDYIDEFGADDIFRFWFLYPLVQRCLPLVLIGQIFYMVMSKTEMTVTNKRVYGKVLFGKRVDLPLDMISAVGTTIFNGVGVTTSSGAIKFLMIKNSEEIHATISKLLLERQNKKEDFAKTVAKEENPHSNADELKKYKELLDMGVITQEEFDAKKKQLLGL